MILFQNSLMSVKIQNINNPHSKMNKYFKLIIQILYPFVCGLLVWLFLFDSESNHITDLIFGIVYIGISIILPRWIYKENNVTIFFSKVGIMVVGGVISIPIFLCIAYTIYSAYFFMSPIAVIIALVSIILSSLFYFIMLFQTRKNTAIFPIIRLSTFVFLLCASVCLLIVSVTIFINIIITEPTLVIFSKWTISIGGVYIVGITILFMISLACIYKITKGIRFITYEKKDYILFLRSFQYDERAHEIISILNEVGGNNIIKIGNPNSIFSKDLSDVLYLPTLHWKRSLNYYISRARHICIVIDYTQGVVWEMFNHLDVINKSLYIVPSLEALSALLCSEELNKYNKTPLGRCILQLKENCDYYPYAFCISNNICYYAPLKSLVPCFLNAELKEGNDIKFFSIQHSDMDNIMIKSDTNNSIYDLFVDRIRSFVRINKRISKMGLNTLTFVISCIFILAGILMAIAGFVGGINWWW